VGEQESVEIGLFEAAFRDIDLPMGLRVDSVHLTGASLRLFKDPLRALAPEPGKVRIVVLEEALTQFVGRKPPWGMKNFRVRIADGKLFFEATKTVLVDLKVKGVCTLRIQDESSVFVDLESVDVVGAGITQLVQSHIDELNPILTTTMLPFPAKLKTLEMLDGKATLWGEISPPE
jgi:hypothetical protein